MHTARFWMALAIPGGAPGYDDDKQFGNFIAHQPSGLPKGCASYNGQAPEVKGRRRQRDLRSLTWFRAFGEGKNAPCRHARCPNAIANDR